MKRLFALMLSILIVASVSVTALAKPPTASSPVRKPVPVFKVTKPKPVEKSEVKKRDALLQYTPESDFTFDAATETITQYIGSDTVVDIPPTIGGVDVKHIGQEAFANSPITDVTIPDGVESIDLGAFGYCAALNNVSIPNSVTELGNYAFYQCESLENITLPNQLESIGEAAFIYCYSLKSIVIPNSVKSLGSASFYWCFALENVTLSNQLTEINEFMFTLCENMKSITIPDSVTFIGYQAFWDCAAAESLTLSKNLTYIDDEAFYYLPLIPSIEIPDSVTYIGSGAFQYAQNATSLTLSKNLTYIGPNAFSQCTSLKSVTIPPAVTTIGDGAFGFDSALESAYFNGNAPANWGTDVFKNTAANFTIYYLSESTGFTSPTYQGYPSVCLYRINVANTSGGSISVASDRAAAGTTVTLTITPDFGKNTQSVYYIDTTGKHAITGNQFIMPAADVTVGAVFGWSNVTIGLFAFAYTLVFALLGLFVGFLFARIR